MAVKGSGKILVMDDELMICDIVGEILSHLGYDCALTKDGTEALKLYEEAIENGERFDSVVMDLTIKGGMGGKEAIKLLLEIDPDARVIVSSGYSKDPVMSNYRKYGFSGVVAKPYTIPKLSEALSMVLQKDV